MSNQLVRQEPMAIQPAPDAIALIRAIKDAGMTADAVKELVLLQEHCQEREARVRFMQAFARAKARITTINATHGIPDKSGKIKWFYAPLEDIQDAIEPILQAEGLDIRFDSRRDGNVLTATCWAFCPDSGYEARADCSINVANAQGEDLGALKKGKRGALTAMFGIKTRHMSEDARVMGDFISEEQATKLRTRLLALGRDERAFLKYGRVEMLAENAPTLADYRKIRTGMYATLDNYMTMRENQKHGAEDNQVQAPRQPAAPETQVSGSAPPSKAGDVSQTIARSEDINVSGKRVDQEAVAPSPAPNPSPTQAGGGAPTTAPATGRPKAKLKKCQCGMVLTDSGECPNCGPRSNPPSQEQGAGGSTAKADTPAAGGGPVNAGQDADAAPAPAGGDMTPEEAEHITLVEFLEAACQTDPGGMNAIKVAAGMIGKRLGSAPLTKLRAMKAMYQKPKPAQ